MDRYQFHQIIKDLQNKIVILAGPRQAGKTWLAKNIGQQFGHTVYLNYDRLKDREMMHAESWLENTELLILDELHKMKGWKNYLKGIFDTKLPHLRILVTGSARLDTLNHLGDSLAGRYFLHHLFPLSPAELNKCGMENQLDLLMDRSGFPEPLLVQDPRDVFRWRQQYVQSLLTLDALEFSQIQDIRALKLIFELLQHRVGSPVSFKAIAEDVGISPTTVTKYIQVLESLYIVFRITPHSKNIARSLLKEPKIYFFDTGLVKGDQGAQFENFVAFCLLKHVSVKKDYEGQDYHLHYLRTKDGEEVDFAITHEDQIELILEAKWSNDELDKSLYTFHNKYGLPAIQLVKTLKREKQEKNIKIIKAENYLQRLYL